LEYGGESLFDETAFTYLTSYIFIYFPLDLYICGNSHNYIKMKYAEHLSQYNSNVNTNKINTI